MNTSRTKVAGRIFSVLAIVIVILFLVSFAGRFVYIFSSVEAQEVGIQFQNNRISDVVGPGVYSDIGLFVSLQTISSQAIPFGVTDEEIITADKQRIGLKVSGDIFRPGIAQKDEIRTLWSQYRGIYTDDDQATARVVDLTRQSMKVCVGDRSFDDNIIGTSRDALRACIDEELNKLVARIGLRIENLVIPEVILSPAVQTSLDAIVQSRLDTEKASQDELRERAQALAEQARQEGEIRVEQSRIQEQTRQQVLLAQLEQERLQAQLVVIEAERANSLAQLETTRVVIEATKANELLAAQENVEINLVLAEAAIAKAEADAAFQRELAALYTANPEYVRLLLVQANASALSASDKIIFTPEGTTPTIVLPGPGIVPTVDTTPQIAPQSDAPEETAVPEEDS